MEIKEKEKIYELIGDSIKIKENLYSYTEEISGISRKIYSAFENGNKILIFGNGGSAADSQHIAGELVGRFKKERKALPAIALTTDTSILTALFNDYNYSRIFERQIEALAKEGDILWGISTSGNSRNVIKAFEKGKELGTYNFSLTGNSGGLIKILSDLNINIDSNNTPRIQEAHQLAYHIICELIESNIGYNNLYKTI